MRSVSSEEILPSSRAAAAAIRAIASASLGTARRISNGTSTATKPCRPPRRKQKPGLVEMAVAAIAEWRVFVILPTCPWIAARDKRAQQGEPDHDRYCDQKPEEHCALLRQWAR